MFAYQPTVEAPTERFFLITVDNSYGTPTISAAVVRKSLGHQRTFNASGEQESIRYYDSDENGYRYASWNASKKNAVRVEDFRLHAYIDVNNEANYVYGTRPMFFSNFTELSDAEQMCATLKHIRRSLEKQEAEYGYTKENDFAQYLLRIAKALGIKKFLTYQNRNLVSSMGEDRAFHLWDTTNVSWIINEYVKNGVVA